MSSTKKTDPRERKNEERKEAGRGREESHIPQIPEDAAGVRPWCLAESSTVLLGRDVMWLEKYRVGC